MTQIIVFSLNLINSKLLYIFLSIKNIYYSHKKENSTSSDILITNLN